MGCIPRVFGTKKRRRQNKNKKKIRAPLGVKFISGSPTSRLEEVDSAMPHTTLLAWSRVCAALSTMWAALRYVGHCLGVVGVWTGVH